MLAFDCVTFCASARSPRLPIIKNVVFKVPSGQIVGLVGPSGVGKSTCVRIAAGTLAPTCGKVSFNSLPIHDAIRDGLVCAVFQEPALMFWLNTRSNANLLCKLSPLPQKRRGRTELDELLEAYSIDAVKAQRPAALSGGQQQRLALVRAVAFRPRLLLLDEPFSALDGETKKRIFPILRRYIESEQMTCVLVAHQDTDLAFFCDFVVPFSFTEGAIPGVSGEPVQLSHLKKPDAYDLDAIRKRADYIRDQITI